MGQSTGSGSAGSEAGHSGTAGRLLPKTRIQPPAAPRTPGTAAPRPGTAAPTPGTASPNPGTAPNTTGSTPQSPNDTPAPNTTSPGSETPGATTQPPEQPVPNSQSREPDRTPFELLESRTRSSVQAVPLFYPNNSELLHKLQSDSNHLFDLRCRARILILRWYFYLDNVVLHCVNN